MIDPALETLTRLEARRLARLARGLVGALTAVALFFLVLDGPTAKAAVSLLGVAGVSLGLSPSLNVMRDRMDGTLGFLASLPVPCGTVVSARLVAVTLGAGLSALVACLGLALLLGGQAPVGGSVTGWLAVWVSAWLLITAASSSLMAILLVFDASAYPRLPLLALAALLALGRAMDALFPHLGAQMAAWARSPGSVGELLLCLGVLAPLWVLLWHRVATWGLGRIPPAPRSTSG